MNFQTAYRGLLRPRQLDQSDGRPLYRYRFTNDEYEDIKLLLKQQKSFLRRDIYGFPLFVMFVAEWFRRDRTGGHWDWIRPLREIGIAYESNSGNSELAYSDLKYIVEDGFRLWKRQLISRGQLLYSVVREAGFPVAALSESNLGTWLQRSVLAIEKGALPEDAVSLEARRISERHCAVMFDAAVELCQVAVVLRKSLSKNCNGSVELAIQLDRAAAGWRNLLPFDVGESGFFALFRDLMDVRGEADRPTKALRAVRTIRKADTGEWRPFASVAFSGRIQPRSIAPSLSSLLAGTDRARLIGRGAWAEFGHPLAVLEKWFSDGQESWEARPLVRGAHFPLDLPQDVVLGALTSGEPVVEFVPEGGQAIVEPVIAFNVEADHAENAYELQLIGATSSRTRSKWLALAVAQHGADVVFEGDTVELGTLGSNYRLVGFSGRAIFERNGVKATWITGADQDHILEIGVSGDTVNSTRGTVYLGRPTLWLTRDGVATQVSDRNIRWRSSGARSWRRVPDAEPVGSVELAATEHDEIIGTARVRILPRNLRLEGDKYRKALIVEGHAGAVVSGTKAKPLTVHRAGDAYVADLSAHPRGEDVELEFRWDSTVQLDIVDPFTEPLLLSPSGRPHPHRGLIAIGRLHGYRLLAPIERRLFMEARNRVEKAAEATVSINGSTPLMSLESQFRELLGSAGTIDARVRLIWEGQSVYFGEIGWYDIAEGLFAVVGGPSARLSAISISAPMISVTDMAQSEKWVLQTQLASVASPGPWLVFGRTMDGAMIRPRVVSEPPPTEPLVQPTTEPAGLDRLIGLPFFAERRESLAQWSTKPSEWSSSDTRKVIGMCIAARQHGVPFNTFDILDVLREHPWSLPHVLAACSNEQERTAVLSLQTELPFLWCTTPISAWLDAFKAATERRISRLGFMEHGEAEIEAQRSIATVLSQIGELEAGVKPHVAALLRVQFSKYLDRLDKGIFAAESRSLRDCADAFVARHGDLRETSASDALAHLVRRYPKFWERYDQTFWDPIAAPIVAAQIAAGQIVSDARTVGRLRTVWHLDRDHFESMFAVAMNNEATNSTYIGGNK